MNDSKINGIIDLIDDGILSEALELHESIAERTEAEKAVPAPAKVLKPKSRRMLIGRLGLIAASFLVVMSLLPNLLMLTSGNDSFPDINASLGNNSGFYGDGGNGGSFWDKIFGGILGGFNGGGAAGNSPSAADTTADGELNDGADTTAGAPADTDMKGPSEDAPLEDGNTYEDSPDWSDPDDTNMEAGETTVEEETTEEETTADDSAETTDDSLDTTNE